MLLKLSGLKLLVDLPISDSLTGKMTAKNENAELQQFYYHPDHLGSSSYISNLDGEVVQHVEYVPFGEVFLEEKNAKWNTPYLFNAKELDKESGMYYYGARYYDPKISLWISTDPLSGYNPIFEKEHYIDGQHNGGVFNSFNLNTYGYCYQNPVKLVDPTGKQAVPDQIEGEVTSVTWYVNATGFKAEFDRNEYLSQVSKILSQDKGLQVTVLHNDKSVFKLKGDFTPELVSDEEGNLFKVRGRANQGNVLEQTISIDPDSPAVGAHELGHGAGLPHIWEDENLTNTPDNCSNLLNSDENPDKSMKDLGGTVLQPSQVKTMKRTFEASRERVFAKYGDLIKQIQNENESPTIKN